jgi:hypothetical protein
MFHVAYRKGRHVITSPIRRPAERNARLFTQARRKRGFFLAPSTQALTAFFHPVPLSPHLDTEVQPAKAETVSESSLQHLVQKLDSLMRSPPRGGRLVKDGVRTTGRSYSRPFGSIGPLRIKHLQHGILRRTHYGPSWTPVAWVIRTCHSSAGCWARAFSYFRVEWYFVLGAPSTH